MPNYYQHNGTSYVHVSDYAALEARLADAEVLLRVMPGYGLSAYDKERWEKARNAFLASVSAPSAKGCVIIGDGYCTTHKQDAFQCAFGKTFKWEEVAPSDQPELIANSPTAIGDATQIRSDWHGLRQLEKESSDLGLHDDLGTAAGVKRMDEDYAAAGQIEGAAK